MTIINIYCCGKQSLRRSGLALIISKCLKCSTWMQSQKLQNDLISVHVHGKPFSITVIQVYALTTNAEEAERSYKDL